MKQPILNLTIDQIKIILNSNNKKKYLADQILKWVYKENVQSFIQMTNVSLSDRQWLDDMFVINPLEVADKLVSKKKDAVKYIFKLQDGNLIESVVLKEASYLTLCISSQCGCGINCQFCLTGVNGLRRNLTKVEIIGQLLAVKQDGWDVSRIVFMGMGEPLANIEAVLDSIEHITNPNYFNMSSRKITVSTSGIIAGIKRLIERNITLNLAFSVGHPNSVVRETIMPIEKTNPIMDVTHYLNQYLQQHNRKLTLEYTLLKGVNDNQIAINELIQLAKYLKAKINLINLNPHKKINYQPVSREVIIKIKKNIEQHQVPVTIRHTKGGDVIAACGQLGESLSPKNIKGG